MFHFSANAFALSSVRAAIETISTSSIFLQGFDVHFAHGTSARETDFHTSESLS